MDNKTKIKIGAAVVIFLIIIWQVIGLFSGGSGDSEEAPKMKPNPEIPKQAELMKQPVKASPAQQNNDPGMTAMQQEIQAKYLAALNELQMLKINKDIAETNKAIMKAKEDTVTSQRKIMNILTPPAPPAPVEQVIKAPPAPSAASDVSLRGAIMPAAPAAPASTVNENLTIVSVTNIRGHWTAVINGGKSLYKVAVGDVIPGEDTTIISIDRSGVTVEKGGVKKKLYMASVI